MNTDALLPLSARWPGDEAIAPASTLESMSDAISNLVEATSSLQTGLNLYAKYMHYDDNDQAAIKAFADANGWGYTLTAPNLPPHADHRPAWFGTPQYSNLPVKAHIVIGELDGFQATMFLLYTPSDVSKNGGSWKAGEKMTTFSRQSIIRVKLPKVFPQLVLDSNRNDKGHVASIAAEIKANQRTSLEGDFDTIFDFYSPRNVPIDTRVVLSPNFMQDAIDGSAIFDVEFYGDEIVFVTNMPLYTPAVLEAALPLIHEQLAYITRLLPSWNYTPITPPFDPLKFSPFSGMPVMKIGRFRFGTRFFLAVVAVVVAVVMAWIVVHAFMSSVTIHVTSSVKTNR